MPLPARSSLWTCLVVTLFAAVVVRGQDEASPEQPPRPQADRQTPPPLDTQWANDYIKGLRWRDLGPGSMGGRIVDLAVVESDPSTYYVATASGGVFKTVNRGVTFEPVFDKSGGSPSIGDICVAPSDPKVVWVGTGEHNARNSVSWGDGVYKSTDGGKTWKHMGLAESFQIGRIAIHPKNPNIVFVGAAGRLWGPNEQRGLFRSEDGGQTWEKVLYVDDNTGCIDIAFKPDDPNVLLAAMYERQRDAYDGGDPAKRWGPGSGLHKSTDGGKTWKRITDGLPTVKMGRIGIGWSRSKPDTVFTIIETERYGHAPKEAKKPAFMGISGGDSVESGARIAEVIREGPSDEAGLQDGDIVRAVDDEPVENYEALIEQIRAHAAGDKVTLTIERGGQEKRIELTFGERPVRGGSGDRPFAASLGGQQPNVQDKQGDEGFETGGVYKSTDAGETWTRINSLNPRPFYYSQIHVDPTDDRYIYVLGIALHNSDDGGKTFKTTGRGVHPDHHAMWIDPNDGRHIVLGCDGGLYVTHDRTATWEFVHNLPIGQFYHVAVDSRRLYNIYGGLQDNGSWGGPSATRSGPGPTAEDWFPVFGGDGFVCAVDPEDPDLIYYEMQYGRLGRVHLRTGERASLTPKKEDGKTYRFNWKTPFLLSHHNSRIYYVAGNYVFRSLNRGEDLRILSPRITKDDKASATALAESPLDPGVLYVGTDDGRLWLTRDGGAGWTDITERVELLKRPKRVSSLEASRYEAGRVYMTLDGHYYDDDRMYALVSEDYGQSWTLLTNDAPAHSARVLREDVSSENVLYLGAEFGAFVSLDRGGHWHSLSNNMPPVAVHEFAQHGLTGEIVAGTHGRGVWVMDATPLRQASLKTLAAAAHLYEPSSAVIWGGFTGKRLFGQKRFVGENRPRGVIIHYHLQQDAKEVSLKVLDLEGNAVRTLKAEGKRGLHTVVWDLRRNRQRNQRFGGAAAPGRYRIVLEAGGQQHTAAVTVLADPTIPHAPTVLELEEQEYEMMMQKMKGLELVD